MCRAIIWSAVCENPILRFRILPKKRRRSFSIILRLLLSNPVFSSSPSVFLTSVFILIGLTVCSCSTIRVIEYQGTPEQIWRQRLQQLSKLDDWSLKGRIGFISERESGSASLYWIQQQDAYELNIVAPLGMGSLVVVGNDSGVVAQSNDGELDYAEDARSLVWQKTGWVIPMGRLRDWILGVPLQDEKFELDEQGRVIRLADDPWQVEYQQYQPVADVELPRKLKIKSPDIELKLVIKDWQLTE